jgi:hypothetical protein
MSMDYFACLGGPGVVSVKNAPGHDTPNQCFCLPWDLRVTCAFRCIQAAKHQRAIFHARLARCGFHRKRTRTHYTELVLLRSVESVGHVVDSGVFGPRNINALLFILV